MLLKDDSELPTEIRVGDPVTRTIRLQAQGLGFEQLPELNLTAPEGAEIYPDKPDTRTRDDGTWLYGERVRKFAFVPTKPGTLTIPGMSVQLVGHRARSHADDRACRRTRSPCCHRPARRRNGAAAATASPADGEPATRRAVFAFDHDADSGAADFGARLAGARGARFPVVARDARVVVAIAAR